MPKLEPEESDPLELRGVEGDLAQGDARFMAECLVEEFLRPGRSAQELMGLFRSPEYALAHRAWLELGELKLFALVSEVAARRNLHA